MKRIMLSEKALYRGSLILVNKKSPFRDDICNVPLVPLDEEKDAVLMERQSAGLLNKLIEETNAKERIIAVSGWRSKAEQADIYEQSIKKNGRKFTQKYVAFPGCSEHHTGLAVDLAENRTEIDFIRPDFPYEGICGNFREKAAMFGFVERYPRGKEKITGIAWEPWHFRYVGIPHALIMRQREMVFEEYHQFLREHEYSLNPYVCAYGQRNAEISYLRAAEHGDTFMEIDENALFTVSGNNTDGFIITVWR